jgi:hypothetical protein
MTPEQDLIADVSQFCTDPLGFVKYIYPWNEQGELEDSAGPRVWQREILEAIGKHLNSQHRFTPLQIAIASGHGIGKSALIAMVCDWAMSTCEDCRIVMTANTEAQLRTKTWPETAKWTRLAINSHWWSVGATSITVREKAHERLWRVDAIPWSENNTEAFAGLHNKGKRIVVIYDEASAIADRIWEVTEGALTDENTEILWLAFGNPTKNTGRFRECFGRYRHRWITRHIDSRTVEGTNKEQLEKWISDYGEDSDFCRVRVRGEFPRAGSTQFIAGDVVASARRRDAGDQSKAYKILSVDVARFGDDQTIIGYRRGLEARLLDKIRGMDVIQVGRQVIMRVVQEKPRSMVIDGDGIGGGVVDYVRTYLPQVWKDQVKFELPKWFKIEEFHGGNTPGDVFMYFNKRAEVWGRMRDWLETGSIPDDPEIEADLCGPEYFFSSKNQVQLEKKEDMKKRGLASPDIGDMLAMTFASSPAMKTRDEALAEQIAAVQQRDPLEAHFMRVTETERRQKAERPLNFWE